MNTPETGEEKFMEQALELASRGRGRTSPNPMVGAVLVKQGAVVGSGYHRRAGRPHAEVEAIADAGSKARGADLYVNLEPCAHRGRTPPCTDAVLRAGIKRVFASLKDPNPLVAGRGGDILRRAGVEVFYGLLAEDAAKLNESYLKHIRQGLPFVTLKSAMTLDGKTAAHTGDSRWISGEESRLEAHRMRDAVDAVLVGIGTVLADDPELTTRLPDRQGKNPLRIIIDPSLQTPEDAKVLRDVGSGGVLIVSLTGAPGDRAAKLRRRGAAILFCDGSEARIEMATLMPLLAERGITSILIEGGSAVAASAVEEGIVDKFVFFIAPKIIGGRGSPTPVGGKGRERMKDALELEEVTYTPCGRDLMVEGYPRRRKN